MNKEKIFIIAGEDSGDLHGAKLVESIKLDMFAFITCDDSITCLIQHEITDHEGYVMTNDYGMYKIVNRDMFSFYNFTLVKNWS